MAQPKGVFERYLDAVQRTGDIMLRFEYQRQMLIDGLLNSQERERLINDVADLVISRLSVTVDISNVLEQIDELNRALDQLGK